MRKWAPITIAVVSDNALDREGMKRILEGDEFTVIGSHRSSAALIQAKDRIEPQIIVLDIGDEESVCSQVVALERAMSQSKVVVLSRDFDFDMMIEAFRAGADGYIVKRIDCEPLIGSLRLVFLGEKVMPSELAQGLPRRWNGGSLPTLSEREVVSLLSDREIETLRFLILGSPNKVIAGHLNISEATVKVHVKAILRKLGAQNRTQAAIWAVNNGIELKPTEVHATLTTNSPEPAITMALG
ncbi:response regulator transcription factor [Parerythrobacter aurantius]|uniref:LuxR C-terminal-related transcriptional regulator n=1 Tax=Parerythrobacter aurantius TaxID=3127706 RepID=UPI00324AF273